MADVLIQIQNQLLKIDPCAKFQPDWTKDKRARILIRNDTCNCLMTSNSDDIKKSFTDLRDFVMEYQHTKFGGDWNTNKLETEGSTMCPLSPQLIFYQNNPA